MLGGGGSCYRYAICCGAFPWHLFYTLWLVVSFCIKYLSLYNETSLIKSESIINLWDWRCEFNVHFDNMSIYHNNSSRDCELWNPGFFTGFKITNMCLFTLNRFKIQWENFWLPPYLCKNCTHKHCLSYFTISVKRHSDQDNLHKTALNGAHSYRLWVHDHHGEPHGSR